MMKARYTSAARNGVMVVLEKGDTLGGYTGPIEISLGFAPGNNEYDALMALVAAGTATIEPYVEPAPPVPDNPTLGDWRVGLVLWRKPDVSTSRLEDVTAAIKALVAAGNPLGVVAQQRLEYSNNVLRKELMQLKDAFGFSAAEVDESLYRARQVSLGDLSGVWPLPA